MFIFKKVYLTKFSFLPPGIGKKRGVEFRHLPHRAFCLNREQSALILGPQVLCLPFYVTFLLAIVSKFKMHDCKLSQIFFKQNEKKPVNLFYILSYLFIENVFEKPKSKRTHCLKGIK